MKNTLLCLALLGLGVSLSAADVVRIPDGKLRGALLAQGIDADNDGKITTAEAAEIEVLTLNELGIIDATGLNAFTQLRTLEIEGNRLSRLDITALTKLERLSIRRNEIRAFDVSKNKNLTWLDARTNQLTALDVRALAALEMLSLVGNQALTRLELGAHPRLNELYTSYTQIASLDLSAYPAIATFEAFNSGLQKLELGEKPALTALVVSTSLIEALDLRGCPKLRLLRANGCPNLRVFSSAGAVALEEAELNRCGIMTADFTGSPLIKTIDLGYNPIIELNIRGLAHLESLDCFDERRPAPSLRQLNYSGTVRLRRLQL